MRGIRGTKAETGDRGMHVIRGTNTGPGNYGIGGIRVTTTEHRKNHGLYQDKKIITDRMKMAEHLMTAGKL